MNSVRKSSLVFAGLVSVIALLALAGWLFRVELLKAGTIGSVAMNPVTAITFLLSAMSLWLLRSPDASKAKIGRGGGALVVAIGAIKLVDYFFAIEPGIDRLLFADQLAGNRMAPNTAAGFLLIGTALTFIDVRPLRRLFPGEALAACACVLSVLCLTGYAFDATSLYKVGNHIPMALNTALAFELLGLGVLFSRANRGVMADLTGPGMGGAAARRLLPVATILPVILGWMRLEGENAGLYDTAFGVALMATVTIVLFVSAVSWTAVALNKADADRRRAQQQLQSAYGELEEKVLQRTAELVQVNCELAQKNQEIGIFRLLVESVQDYAILMLDPQGRVLTWNAGAERSTGYVSYEIIGQHFSVFYPSEVVAQGLPERELATAKTDGRFEDEGWRVRKDGMQFWANVLMTPLWEPDGRLAGFAKITRDLTERRAAEESARRAAEELKQRDEQLRQAQKMEAVGTLAGGVAHEFNNLLQAIQAYTRFGQSGLSPDDQRFQDLQQVLAVSDRAAGLTRQLLGFGRRQALELTNCDPNQLTKDLIKMLRPLIGADITIELHLAEQVGTIHADPGHFQHLMMNLCVNARDAMPNGGTLLIKTEDLRLSQRYCDVHPDVQPGRYLVLTVSDTGIGMSPEVAEHIFEPFFTTKDIGKGTGLGLALVYGVVQQHHGVIRVYSEVGMGTTFKIYMPTVEGDGVSQPDDSMCAPQGGTETILVAEDEPVVRDAYQRILGAAGYQLLIACDGREAWEMFQAHKDEIDLLVSDVVMPHQSGRNLHRQIQDVKPEIPAIFCSGYDPETAHIRFTGESDCPFLQKPFDPNVLLETVRQVLDREVPCLVH